MQISNADFDHVTSVHHQGNVLSFATRPYQVNGVEGDFAEILYSVLDVAALRSETEEEASGAWTAYRVLPFPETVAPVGQRLLARPYPCSDPSAPWTSVQGTQKDVAPVALSEDGLVYLFRASNSLDGRSLLVDRFEFDPGTLRLRPAREARFVRSQLADLPKGERDSLARSDLDGEPFLVATQEIRFADSIYGGFAVVRTPSQASPDFGYWHFLLGGAPLKGYRLAKTPLAAFDRGSDARAELESVPDGSLPALTSVWTLAIPDGMDLPGLFLPSALLYAQQEDTLDLEGNRNWLQRAARVMVACIYNDTTSALGPIMVFDFAVAEDGTLTEIGDLSAQFNQFVPEVLGTCLEFDGRNDSVRAEIGSQPGLFIALWFWRAAETESESPPTRCLASIGDSSKEESFAFGVDSSGRIVILGQSSQGMTRWKTGPFVPPERWTEVWVSVAPGAAPQVQLGELLIPIEEWTTEDAAPPNILFPLKKDLTFGLGDWVGEDSPPAELAPFQGKMSQAQLCVCLSSNFDSAAPTSLAPILDWRMEEGSGDVLSETLAYSGLISGAEWVPGPCKSRLVSFPVLYRDSSLLDLRGAYLNPPNNTVAIDTSETPCLLASSDSRVDLYFKDSQNRLVLLHMSTRVGRAQRVYCWHRPSTTQEEAERVGLLLTSKLVGYLSGVSLSVSFGAYDSDSQTFETVEIHNKNATRFEKGAHSLRETWSKMPAELSKFCAVLNGEAIQAATTQTVVENQDPEEILACTRIDSRALDQGEILYDYASNVTLEVGESFSTMEEIPRTLNPGESFASVLVRADSIDVAEDEDTCLIPERPEDRVEFVLAGSSPWWLQDPAPEALHLYSDVASKKATWVEVEDSESLAFLGDLTAEILYFDSFDKTPRNEIGLCRFLGSGGDGFSLGIDKKGRVTAFRFGQAGGIARAQRTTSAISLEDWAQISCVYRSSFAIQLRDQAYVECNASKALDPRRGMTAEAWIRPDALSTDPSEEKVVLSRWNSETSDLSWKLSILGSELKFTVKTGEGYVAPKLLSVETSGANLEEGAWVHASAIYCPSEERTLFLFDPDLETYVYLEGLETAGKGDLTVEAWVRLTEASPKNQCILQSVYRSGTKSRAPVLSLELDSGGALVAKLGDLEIQGPSLEDPRSLHHVAIRVTLDEAQDESLVELFVDGYLSGFAKGDSGFAADTKCGWVLGMDVTDSPTQDPFSGSLGELRIWSYARSTEEILGSLTREFLGKEEGLAACLPMTQPGSGSGLVRKNVTLEDLARDSHYAVRWVDPDPRDASVGLSFSSVSSAVVFGIYLKDGEDPDAELQSFPETVQDSRPISPTKAAFCLGTKDPVSRSVAFQGGLDDVRIWDGARLPSQIDFFAIRELSQPLEDATLLGAWNMDEGRGKQVRDLKGTSSGEIREVSEGRGGSQDDLWVATSFGGSWSFFCNGAELSAEAPEFRAQAGVSGFMDRIKAKPGLVVGSSLENDFDLELEDGNFRTADGFYSEFRLWESARSRAEIVGALGRPLRGDEDGLLGYWPLRDSSGLALEDRTPDPRDGQIHQVAPDGDTAGPAWGPETAKPAPPPIPVTQEDPRVILAGNGLVSPSAENFQLAGSPSVQEFSVGGQVRKTYLLLVLDPISNLPYLSMEQGSSVSEVEKVYLGQVQFDAQIVGYIEGGPPVPSENLTINQPSNPDRYAGTASVSLHAGDGKSKESDFEWEIHGGLGIDYGIHLGEEMKITQTSSGAGGTSEGLAITNVWEGFSFGVEETILHQEGEARLDLSGSAEGGGGQGSHRFSRHGESREETVVVAGSWENNVYNIPLASKANQSIQAKRLYRPNNMGAAFVRSRTGDLFGIRSKATGAILDYEMEENSEIPEDTNVLMFRLNPKYVKNGSLDGAIGFDVDLDFEAPGANVDVRRPPVPASYFRPAEAYRMLSSAERQRADERDPHKKDFANRYLWTADGGLFAEEEHFGARKTEVHQGGLNLLGKAKLSFKSDLDTGLVVSVKLGGSLDFGLNLQAHLKWTNTKGSAENLRLTSQVEGEGFLSKVLMPFEYGLNLSETEADSWKADLDSGTVPSDLKAGLFEQGVELTSRAYIRSPQQETMPGGVSPQWVLTDVSVEFGLTLTLDSSGGGTTKTATFTLQSITSTDRDQYPILFDPGPCPGKVRSYRFLSIYQHPQKENFDFLFEGGAGTPPVVDPDWLGSSDPDAVALRDAKSRRNSVWRVLHRVTYVNRVPVDPSLTEFDPETVVESDLPKSEVFGASGYRPDDYSVAENSDLIAQALAGQDSPDELDLVQLNLNVTTLVDGFGEDLSTPEQSRLHEAIMEYLEAILASDRED